MVGKERLNGVDLTISFEEVSDAAERLRKVLGIRQKADFHFSMGEKLDTPWKELAAIIDMLEVQKSAGFRF